MPRPPNPTFYDLAEYGLEEPPEMKSEMPQLSYPPKRFEPPTSPVNFNDYGEELEGYPSLYT